MLKFCLLHSSLYSIQNGCLWKAWGWNPILALYTWPSDVLDSTACRYLPARCARPLMSRIWFLFRCGSVSGLSLWISWSVCLFLHQDHCFSSYSFMAIFPSGGSSSLFFFSPLLCLSYLFLQKCLSYSWSSALIYKVSNQSVKFI